MSRTSTVPAGCLTGDAAAAAAKATVTAEATVAAEATVTAARVEDAEMHAEPYYDEPEFCGVAPATATPRKSRSSRLGHERDLRNLRRHHDQGRQRRARPPPGATIM